MTHQEAIGKLLSMYPNQGALARAMGVSQQSISNIKRKGVLPRKHWPMVGAEPTIQMGVAQQPALIDVNTLTILQAKALYEQLKEVFK